MSKKERVKNVFIMQRKTVTIEGLLYHITGLSSDFRWHETMFEVSASTVRRALDELVRDGKAVKYMTDGHCYDHYWYKLVEND